MTKYKYKLEFETEADMDKEQTDDFVGSMIDNCMGFMEFNTLKLISTSDSFVNVSNKAEDKSEHTEKKDHIYKYMQTEKLPYFQCDNCEDEFEDDCCFTNGNMIVCRKCYEDFYYEDK